ncbi:TPA: hypothetical protein ACGF1T_002837, partial [Vibrio cholerae]
SHRDRVRLKEKTEPGRYHCDKDKTTQNKHRCIKSPITSPSGTVKEEKGVQSRKLSHPTQFTLLSVKPFSKRLEGVNGQNLIRKQICVILRQTKG